MSYLRSIAKLAIIAVLAVFVHSLCCEIQGNSVRQLETLSTQRSGVFGPVLVAAANPDDFEWTDNDDVQGEDEILAKQRRQKAEAAAAMAAAEATDSVPDIKVKRPMIPKGKGIIETIQGVYLFWWDNLTVENMKYFYVEMCLIGLIAVYIAMYLYSKTKYSDLAKFWSFTTLGVWRENFAHIGDGKMCTLFAEGTSDYMLYASGRKYINRLYGFIHFAPRVEYGDVLRYAMELQTPQKLYDHVTFKVKLDVEHLKLQRIVFAIVPALNVKRSTKDRWDVDSVARKRTLPWYLLPASEYACLTDCPEIAEKILSDPLVHKEVWRSVGFRVAPFEHPEFSSGAPLANRKLIEAYSADNVPFTNPMIEHVFFSDLPREEPASETEIEEPNYTLQFKFRLTTTNKFSFKATKSERKELLLFEDYSMNAEVNLGMAHLVMDITDAIVVYSGELLPQSLLTATKQRDAIKAMIYKKHEEERKQRLADEKYKAKMEREAEIMNLPRDEQRKVEAKERKRAAKKERAKMMKKAK